MKVDVAVVGAGNAALSAAISAAEAGASVLVLEKASRAERGGNSRFTGGLLRFAFASKEDALRVVDDMGDATPEILDVGPYTVEDYLADVLRLCDGRSDQTLIRLLAEQSSSAVDWLAAHGVRYELYEKYVEHEGKRNWPDRSMIKAQGGGEGLVAALFASAEKLDRLEIRYDAQVVGLDFTSFAPGIGLDVRIQGELTTIEATSVVLGAGGFEASPQMRAAHLGQSWDLAKARGTRHNTGEILALMVEAGAAPVGHWSGCHAVPVDADSADYGDLRMGALTTRLSYPYGVMVNVDGRRFVDEGSDFKLLTYAKIGREVLAQPRGIAYQIFDQQTLGQIEPRYALGSAPIVADTIAELATGLGLNPAVLTATIDAFNAAASDAPFNPAVLDGKGTPGLEPPKSNWATKIEQGPFVAYRVTCGITFTYGGIAIDTLAQVQTSGGWPIPGLYATGEITGGFFYHNYAAGTGLMRGTVFGRIAGQQAAARAQSLSAAVGAVS